MSITLESRVGQLVVDKPLRARVFQQFQIDFCCGGGISLRAACERKAVDPQVVIAELLLADTMSDSDKEPDWTKERLSALIDNIVSTHHTYLRKALPTLGAMAEKVYHVHGENHPELRDLLETFSAMYAELDSHMYKEENILFPAVKQIEMGVIPPAAAAQLFGPISVMEAEHESAGRALAELRRITHNYAPPEGACNTYRGLFAGLEELERDLHWHIHKENNILFPRAMAGA
jgi:regulator of cell morphogenesis and NO signaling